MVDITGWGVQAGDTPLPPNNPMAFSTLGVRGGVDIRWDDPSLLARNSRFNIVGVNIYRSDVSERGPYFGPINDFPLGGGFYRDQTQVTLVEREVVDWNTDWQHKGDGPNNRAFVLMTSHPIVKADPVSLQRMEPVFADSPNDVRVYVDGQEVPVEGVLGRAGLVRLVNATKYDQTTDTRFRPPVPDENSVVEVSYHRQSNLVQYGLDAKVFYRLVTVAVDPNSPGLYIETPLDFTKPVNRFQVETVDWVWREAIRRNHWILQQGGERVKLFVRRTAGVPCDCMLDPMVREYNKQPLNSCEVCFGTGYIGGYEGPYDIIIVQDGVDNTINQRIKGRTKMKSQDVWMTMTPYVSQRDFLVKQTGERFAIGPVTRHTARGAVLQQHYQIGYLDEGDIRYRVPIDGVADLINPPHTPHTRYAQTPEPLQPEDNDTSYQGQHHIPTEAPFPVGDEERWPQVTDKDNIPEERQGRGRTPVWENIEYIWPFILYVAVEMFQRTSEFWV